mmetsp:Transcript_8680/g.38324  ORF Transcript_8680/g.38324 Transcript_8680/m.38324 type:complete len:214 (-) Transcript_8680:516-1157(-)
MGHASRDQRLDRVAVPLARRHLVRQGRRPRQAEEAVPHPRLARRAHGAVGLRARHPSRRHRHPQGVHPGVPLQHRETAPLPPVHPRAAGPRGRRPDREPSPRRPRRPPGRDPRGSKAEGWHRVAVRPQRGRHLRRVRREQAGVRGQARVRRHRRQRDHRRVQTHVVVQAPRDAKVPPVLRLPLLRRRRHDHRQRGRQARGHRGLRVRPDLGGG